MQGDSIGEDDRPPMRQMSAEQFEALLIEVRNGAAATVTDLVVERMEGAEAEGRLFDARSVWHATEIALAVLLFDGERSPYIAKREAREETARLVRQWESLDQGV
jgi:hypothetical protein